MMKHFFLIPLLAGSMALHGSAQHPTAPGTITDSTASNNHSVNTEIKVISDSIPQSDVIVFTRPESDDAPQIVTVDDDEYLIHKGHAYELDKLTNTMQDFNHEFQFMPRISSEESYNMEHVIAICFIVPCITIIIVLVLLLMFFMRRTQARNAIIEKAIDADYMLPDAFYMNQSNTAYIVQSQESTADPVNPEMPSIKTPYRRDPKKFSNAITLLAVGLALIIFFCIHGSWGLTLIAGGTLLFLGIGNLIGYFYIPGYTEENIGRKRHMNNHANQGYPYNMPGQQPPRNYPPHTPQNPGSYPPPPYNNQDNHTR